MTADQSVFQTVESVDDRRLDDFRGLRNRPSGRAAESQYFVVEGQLIVERLLTSGFRVRSIIIDQGRDPNLIGPIPDGTNIFALSRDQIETLAGFHFHRGYLASAWRETFATVDEFRPDRVSLAVVEVTDMENLGSMLRSAAAFGINQILIDPKSADPYSRRVIRVSMGAALGMRFVSSTDPAADLRTLGDRGVVSLAATLAPDSDPIDRVTIGHHPTVIVMGNEATGLPDAVQKAATRRVLIPMGKPSAGPLLVDSLNVSVAAAILLHRLA